MGTVTHAFVSAVVDAGNPNEVGPDEWNAGHTIAGTFPPDTHTHVIGDTTGLQAALDAKEPLGEYIALNDQTGTTYTFAATDKGVLVSGNNAGAQTFTVPPNASVVFPVKSRIDIWQKGAGQITIAAGAGVTLRSAGARLKLNVQYSAATLTKVAADEWLVFGDLLP